MKMKLTMLARAGEQAGYRRDRQGTRETLAKDILIDQVVAVES
jgi:hypothetical protein